MFLNCLFLCSVQHRRMVEFESRSWICACSITVDVPCSCSSDNISLDDVPSRYSMSGYCTFLQTLLGGGKKDVVRLSTLNIGHCASLDNQFCH